MSGPTRSEGRGDNDSLMTCERGLKTFFFQIRSPQTRLKMENKRVSQTRSPQTRFIHFFARFAVAPFSVQVLAHSLVRKENNLSQSLIFVNVECDIHSGQVTHFSPWRVRVLGTGRKKSGRWGRKKKTAVDRLEFGIPRKLQKSGFHCTCFLWKKSTDSSDKTTITKNYRRST